MSIGYMKAPPTTYVMQFKDGRVKVELGVAKGKKTHDKREEIARKTEEKEAKAEMGRARRGGS